MSKARLVITALFTEGLTPSQVAERYGVHRAWVYKLKARYEAEGDTALEPRSRAPRTNSNATPAATVDWSYGSANNSPRPAWTPAPTPSTGTCATATAPCCRGPRSTGSWSAPAN